jgi:hypothetical protein
MKPKIGDLIWRAALAHSVEYDPCPDCCGRRALRVILGDDSEVVIDCSTCAQGYNPPRGIVARDVYTANPVQVLIAKVETELLDGEEVSLYSGDGFYHAAESDLCMTEADAEKRAAELIVERDKETAAKMNRKEKDTRTWAWHVTYHRRCIKQAEKDLAYHRAKLETSLLKSKTEQREAKR